MLATLVAFKKGVVTVWRGGKKLVRRWRQGEDAIEVDSAADQNLPTMADQKKLTKKRQSWLRWFFNVIVKLCVNYVFAMKEVGVFFLLIEMFFAEQIDESLVGREWWAALNRVSIGAAVVETFFNLFAEIKITNALQEALEKAIAVAVIARLSGENVSAADSSIYFRVGKRANPAVLIAGLGLALLDSLEMGFNVTDPRNHLPMGVLKKSMRSPQTLIATKQAKIRKWLKTILILPIRLIQLLLPSFVDMVNTQFLPVLFFGRKGRKFSIYASWFVAAIGLLVHITSLRLGNHKDSRQLKRDPLYYIWLGYNTFSAVLLIAVQAQVFALQMVFQAEVLLGDKNIFQAIYPTTDPYAAANIFIHLFLAVPIVVHQTIAMLGGRLTKKMKAQRLSAVRKGITLRGHQQNIVESAHRFQYTRLRERGFFNQSWRDFKAYVDPDSVLIKHG
jgi:hypothetical protein